MFKHLLVNWVLFYGKIIFPKLSVSNFTWAASLKIAQLRFSCLRTYLNSCNYFKRLTNVKKPKQTIFGRQPVCSG